MRLRRSFTFILVHSVIILVPLAARAHAPVGASSSDQLGKVEFPSSCPAEAQPMIEKGLALLHSFQYTESEKTFADAAARDPKCAIAYWGEAMAL
jgi:hypothetical protein